MPKPSFTKKFKYTLFGMALLLGIGAAGVVSMLPPGSSEPKVSAAMFNGPRDCDSNAVIRCGAMTVNELQRKYHRQSGAVDIFNYFNITKRDMANLDGNVKRGVVTKDGRVIVDGKVVATDAITAGRQAMPGSRKATYSGTTFYVREPSVSFRSDRLEAFVVMENGHFEHAILASCGNPIKANPKPAPKPEPKPKPQPKPQLVCKDLNVKQLSDRKYRFTAHAEANNNRITSYTFQFGDGEQRTVRTNNETATVTHTYAEADQAYQGRVVVDSKHKQNVTSDRCDFKLKTPSKPKPQPKAELVCKDLSFELGDNELTYTFTATAQAENTEIISYVFDFGDGETETVDTASDTASVEHTYDMFDTTFHAFVEVNGKNRQAATSENCMVKITTPREPAQPELVCTGLTFMAVTGQDNTYEFIATANAEDTDITSYNFDFGDGENQTVTTTDETAQATHTYANAETDFTATVEVNSSDVEGVTSDTCQITIPAQSQPPEECKPGVPVGSPECEEEQPQPTPTPPSPTPQQPTPSPVLPDTGLGAIGNIVGFFSATSLAGGLIHHFILRRKVAI